MRHTRPALALAAALTCTAALAAPAARAATAPTAAPANGPSTAAATGATRVAGTTPADEQAPRWRTVGRWVVDESGRVVITHGVNEVEKHPPYAPDAIGFGDDDAAFLAREGFTSVRLGVLWTAVEPTPGHYDDAYLDRIAATVATLHAHGIASVLDFHQDMANERFQGEGWPDWAVLDKGAPNVIKAGFPGNYFLNEGVKNAFDSFHANAPAADGVGVADHYAAAWRHVAARFAGTPGVQGYDLYNEPFPGHGYSLCLTQAGCRDADARLADVQQRAVDAIRAVDPHTIVWYEPMQFFNIGVGTNVRLRGTNLGLSFHDYCVNQATLHRYAGCAGPDAAVFRNADEHSDATAGGLLLTEFGATTVPQVARAQVDLAASHRVGWMWWAYTAGDPTTAGPGNEQALVLDPRRAPEGANVDDAKLDSIAVPHPDRVAGTPTGYGYDRSARTFTMSWDATRPQGGAAGPDDETLVRLPGRLLARGYDVQARGAHVTSSAGDPVLRLHLDDGATSASVRVTLR